MLKACWLCFIIFKRYVEFSGLNSVLAGIPLTNAHGENRQFSLQNMFYLCLFNSVVIQYFLSNFAHMHFCDMHHKWLGPNCCKCKTVSEILRQNVTMHAAGLIRLACGPTAHTNHLTLLYFTLLYFGPVVRGGHRPIHQSLRIHRWYYHKKLRVISGCACMA